MEQSNIINYLNSTIKHATNFGTFSARKSFPAFIIKIIIYMIPAIIIGYYTDKFVFNLKNKSALGENNLYYIVIQTLIIAVTLFVIADMFPNFLSEFQSTLTGGIFVVLYFGMQDKYIDNIKSLMNTF